VARTTSRQLAADSVAPRGDINRIRCR